ncbi:hypothetical protein TI04_10270 [Achromatium sp. WMS2]|nr:hypothetical protein TI04_10270 [Achromatium sp. WMS2]
MNFRYLIKLSIILICIVFAPIVTSADRISVVASFSILGDLIVEVGGNRVDVNVLVGPDSDAHIYQPTPQDAKRIAHAKLVVINGLGFEGWMERLIKTSGFSGLVTIASTGVVPRLLGSTQDGTNHSHNDHSGVDPHAWQNLQNGIIYVRNISQALSEVDPQSANYYQQRAANYIEQLKQLDQKLRQYIAALPIKQRKIITSHDAFGYLADAYDLTVLSPIGISTDTEASAAGVAKLIRQIRHERVKAIFIENISDTKLIRQIASETGVKIGGTLFSDALSTAQGPANSYQAMIKHNVSTIFTSLGIKVFE